MKKSISFRQIKNGYIMEESKDTKDGYERDETYVKSLPKGIAEKVSDDGRDMRTNSISKGLKKK